MDRHKNYHLYAILAIVIAILLIIFFSLYIGRRNTTGSSPQASSSVSPPGTGVIKDADDDTEVSLYLEEQDIIMSDMMQDMSLKESGSAEYDFLAGMIPHHEAAIDMTKNYLLYGGENKKLKKLANEIIEEQQEEVEEMRSLVQEIRKSGITDKEKERGYLKSYNKMMSAHQHIGHETGTASNVEEAYIDGMVLHHQMAADMAGSILEFSDHEEIRDIAEDIIELQKEEISQMEEISRNM